MDSKHSTTWTSLVTGLARIRTTLGGQSPSLPLRPGSAVECARSRRSRGQDRRGVTLILAILCLAVSTLLIANLTRMVRLDGQSRVNHQHALQAERLAQFGWKYAAERLTADPTYSGGAREFSIPATTGRQPTTHNGGRITVSVQRDGQPMTVTVVALYPIDQPNQVTTTLKRTLSLATPSSGVTDERP